MKTPFSLFIAAALCLSTLSYAQAKPETATPNAATEATPTEGEKTDKETKVALEELPAAATPALAGPAQATDRSLMLREQVKDLDKLYAELKEPSRSLSSMLRSAKKRIARSTERLDESSLKANELQQRYNSYSQGDYEFKNVTLDQRMKYMDDAKKAYEAMINDISQNNIHRVTMGLNRFEIIDDRYRGVPEYKEAYHSYLKKVKIFHNRMTKFIENEERKRLRLRETQMKTLLRAEAKDNTKMAALLKEQGYDIRNCWYAPNYRNLSQLENMKRKSNGIAENYDELISKDFDENIGTIDALLTEFWQKMDAARELMIAGNFEEADKVHNDNQAFRRILSLNRNLLPEEYRTPLRKEYRDMDTEINKRKRELRSLQSSLDRQLSVLERSASGVESQISAIKEEIQREIEMQIEDNAAKLTEADQLKASQEADEGATSQEENSADGEGQEKTSTDEAKPSEQSTEPNAKQ